MSRKEAQNKWDTANMASHTIRVKKTLLDRFKEACAKRGDKVNTVLRKAMENYVDGEETKRTDESE